MNSMRSSDPSSSQDEILLPAGARLVHIGPHKTGSTAIQSAMRQMADQLGAYGVAYPGSGTRDRKAGWGLGLPGRPAGTERPSPRHWERFVAQVRLAGDLRVCVSNEDFGKADEASARRIVHDLGGDSVHVVAVARRLDRYLPSQWQERVKAGETRDYSEWLSLVLGDETWRWNYRNTWQAHDVAALVRRWTDIVGPDRMTLIVSDDSDRMRIPREFEAMLGLPRDFLQVDPQRSNRSLTYAETELVRALNQDFRQRGWDNQMRRRYVRRAVVTELARRPGSQSGPRAPGLPAWALDQVRQISEERVRAVRELPARIVGDPADLLIPESTVPSDSNDAQVIDVQAAAAVIERSAAVAIRKERRKRARARARPDLAAPVRGRAATGLERLRRLGPGWLRRTLRLER